MNRLRMLALGAGLSIVMSGLPALAKAAAPGFDQILAAPDDPDLNLKYARAQAEDGHLLQAAAALERVLTLHPEWDTARLFYAVVLYRLDDLQGAAAQMSKVNTADLTPLDQAQAAAYKSRIAQGRGRVSLHGDVALGAVYDSNATGALATQLDSPFAAPSHSGSAGEVSGDIEADVKLRDGGSLAAYGALSGQQLTGLSGPNHDYGRIEGQAGLADAGVLASWRIGALVRDYSVFNHHYLTEAGARAEADYRLGPADKVSGSVELASQAYDQPLYDTFTGINRSEDGWRYVVLAGLEHRFGARSTLYGGVGFEDKEANYRPFAYEAESLQARYDLFLGRGVYVDASGSLRFVQYRADDVIFLGTRRKDTQSQERIAIGAPLSAFTPAGVTGDYRENLIIEAALSHLYRDTVFPLADYDDVAFELRLIWRFGVPR